MPLPVIDAERETGFTPGPWRACKEGACSCGMVWSLPADFHVATAHQSWGDCPEYPDATMPLEMMQANARLIAAAPSLYAALATLEPALVRDLGAGYAGVALIQAALSKARTGAPE